jgi:hypothetical protein
MSRLDEGLETAPLHRGESVRRYDFRDADTLIDDFWREVEAILKNEGIE